MCQTLRRARGVSKEHRQCQSPQSRGSGTGGQEEARQDAGEPAGDEARSHFMPEEGIFLEAWAVFKEGIGTTSRPKGPKGKGSFWTNEMMCLWRGPPAATEAFSEGTQPTHGDQVGEGARRMKTPKLTFLPASHLLPVPQRMNSTGSQRRGRLLGVPTQSAPASEVDGPRPSGGRADRL